MQNMRRGKFKEALKHLKISRSYPQHLGVGKPYHPDQRVQDYLAAHIYQHQNKPEKMNSLYQNILTYSKQYRKGRAHKFTFGNLVSLLTYEHYGQNQRAQHIRKQIIQNLKGQPAVIKWLKAQENSQRDKMNTLVEKILSNEKPETLDWFMTFLCLKKDKVL
jgi:hypothetical protein